MKKVFVGYDDVCDYVWDVIPPGRESDYNTALITEEVIDTWPALIGWHEEAAKGPAIEAIVDDERIQEIVAKHPV